MADGEVKIEIDGKVYSTATLDEISLRDVVLFNSQAKDIGLDVSFADVEQISNEMAELGDTDVTHPDAMIMFAVTIWAARRIAGDDVTLGEAIDVPMKSIKVIEARKAPKDHKPKKPKSLSTRPASVPAIEADASMPSLSGETTPLTSESRSVSA